MSANWDGLTLPELTTAMTAGLGGAKRDRVQLAGWVDAVPASWALLEVALVMRDYAEYLVGVGRARARARLGLLGARASDSTRPALAGRPMWRAFDHQLAFMPKR